MIFRKSHYGFFKPFRTSTANRPVIKPEMAPLDWLLEGAALLGLMVLFGFVIYHFQRLPETIPSHFNSAGQPDDYSSKSSIWMLPGVAIFVYVLLGLFMLIPNQFNYPVKINPANARRQYTMAIRLVRYLKAAIIWLFFYISSISVRVAAKEDSGLGLWFLPIVLGGIFLPLIVYFIMAFKSR
ncbi:MAG: DUF1648 domain-containing protein [Bacteroidales bacterium]|nr:DUF1648 domain-containing protein [Bacteroidales bacterium]